MKHILKSRSFGIAVLSASTLLSTMSIAQFDVELNGRVDFLAGSSEAFSDSVSVTGATNSAAVSGAGSPVATFATEAALNAALTAAGGTITRAQEAATSDLVFNTVGRLDLAGRQQTETLDFGAFVRLDIDPDKVVIDDVDGHAFIAGGFGKLKFGTDIDANQGVFDTDHISAGPLSPGKNVTFGGSISQGGHGESSLVYMTPTLLGFRIEGEIDDDSDWTASISYRGSAGEIDYEGAFGGDSSEALGAFAKADYGDFTVLGFYMRDDDSETAGGGGLAWHAGPLKVSLDASVAQTNELVGIGVSGITGVSTANVSRLPRVEERDIVLGAKYDLAPGLELSGSLGHSDNSRLGDVLNAKGRLRINF